MTNPRDDGEADDIAKQEAESVADAKRRLAKRSGTNPRDDGDAVVLLTRFAAPRKGIKETFREPDANGIRRAEYHYALTANECNMIATLSRQLAEAQGVIERQRKGLEAAEQWLSGWASAEPYISAIRAAISPPQEQHPAALQTSEKP